MNIGTERIGSAVVLRLNGRMSAECDAGWMQTALAAASRDGVRHVLVDFGRVSRMDCCGIGQLVALRGQLHGARRSICLVGLDRHHQRMLELAGLLHVFRAFRDCDAAASALGVKRETLHERASESVVPAGVFGRGRPEACWASSPV